jgi:hypothetical protein
MYNDNINDNNNDKKFDRVINIINSSMKGEFENLKKVYDNENPYDLFTLIYPTLFSQLISTDLMDPPK